MKIIRFLSCAALVVAIAGCAIPIISKKQVEREKPVPAFFVEYEKGTAELNNRYVIKQRIDRLSAQYEKKPVFVLVANGNDIQEYSLAVSRLFSISNISEENSFRVLVMPLERREQANRVAVYHAQSWNSFNKEYMAAGEFSLVEGADGVYRSSDKRLFYAEPAKTKLMLDGNWQVEQLDRALTQLGWSLDAEKVELSDEEKVFVRSIDVVTLGPVATRSEVKLLVSAFVDKAFPSHSFSVNSESKKVRIWKVNIVGDES